MTAGRRDLPLRRIGLSDTALLCLIAAATVVLHMLTGGQYGFHRDELATLDDARHLAWGYVAYPPITPFFGRVSLELFGTSLRGFRFFAAVAQAIALVLTGLMARELGGRRGAQLLAAFAALPLAIAAGVMMQYVAFDYLFWVLTAYLLIRLLKSGDPRWWVAIGASIGLGMMAKYGMVFFVCGIAAGVLLTDARRYLASKWLLVGVAVSFLIFLPNLLWQIQHDFISLEFLKHIHERDVRIGRAKDFLPDQLKFTLLAFPLWIAGLYYYLASRSGRPFRAIGWMYVAPLVIFIIAKARGYYLIAAYPMLYAGGSVWLQGVLDSRPQRRRLILGVASIALAVNVLPFVATSLPVAPINSRWFNFASKNNDDLVEMIGWPELVQEIARIRDTLTTEERQHLGILAANYGEAGALNLYGPALGLPAAISGVNSFWERGYGEPPPETLIVLGLSEQSANDNFSDCRLAGRTPNPHAIKNEETQRHPDIYICRQPKSGWSELWKKFRYFG
jgi:4-amino-4-deoxy-L-arabinose transferase-like glycosyltransferase